MHYLPMHAPLNPNMVKYFFIYLGSIVEALTGAGAGRMAGSAPGTDRYRSGGTLIAVALVLQGVVELVFMSMVALLHYRCKKARMLSRNVNIVCITLYGTSALVLLRCLFRAVESFESYTHECIGAHCGSIVRREWYLYVFEAAPMVLYTFWLNVFHPGMSLPSEYKRYLDIDGRTERMGPGWIDERPVWLKALDPFNLQKDERACGERTKFWMKTGQWAEFHGSFVLGTDSNRTSDK
jgi:RTA1 like protein